MIFGDEPRFYPDMRTTHRREGAYAKDSTDQSVGPGSHYSQDLENKRTGWTPKNSPGGKRQPMTKGSNEKDRSDYFIHGHLSPGGIVVPNPSERRYYPSPGQYDSAHSRSNASTPDLRKSSSMGSSPRFAPSTAVLKDGVCVAGSRRDAEDSASRGPGLYEPSAMSTPMDDRSFSSTGTSPSSLHRKSFNARASSGNSKGAQAASTYLAQGIRSSPYHSPRASPRTTPGPTSPRIGSPRRTSDSFYGSPKRQGVPGGGVTTPVLSSPSKRSPPFGPAAAAANASTVQGQGGKQKTLIGGPGGGFGPGKPTRQTNSPPPPLPAQSSSPVPHQGRLSPTPTSGRGTPTGIPGTASPAVGGSARGTYLALYAGTPVRHNETKESPTK